MRWISSLAMAVLLSGCAGAIHSQPFDAANWTDPVEGVVYYAPSYVKVTHAFTTRVDKDGKVVGTADAGTCLPVVQKEEIQIMPDFSKAYRVSYEAGLFGTDKFGVTLSNGMLTGVNAETSAQTAPFLTAAGGLATGVAALAVPPVDPAPGVGGLGCNAGARIAAFEPVTLGNP